jgi:hypothetical protein
MPLNIGNKVNDLWSLPGTATARAIDHSLHRWLALKICLTRSWSAMQRLHLFVDATLVRPFIQIGGLPHHELCPKSAESKSKQARRLVAERPALDVAIEHYCRKGDA